MPDPSTDKSFTIQNYLNFANNSLEPKITSTDSDFFDPFARTSLLNQQEQVKLSDDGNVLDFFGQLAWGGLSGITWGASESETVRGFTGQEHKHFQDMNDWEKAGWVTGEGLSLFAPVVGPFAILGRGGSFVARKAGNRFIREAAEEVFAKHAKIAETVGIDPFRKKLSAQLYSGLTHKKMAQSMMQLQADEQLARTASPYLRAQSKAIIDKVLKDRGISIAPGASRAMAEEVVAKLSSGTYVNDIGSILTRALGSDPGFVSKYVGMAAQDFLYMGLHALGTEQIDAIVEKRSPQHSQRLRQSGIMALAFPLIRKIKGGGNESIMKGAQAYFSRFKKIDYKKLGKDDLTAAKALLEYNVNGTHFNIFNTARMKGKSWSVNGTEYSGATIRSHLKTDGGKYFDDRPQDVVALLNKMRTETSKEFVKMVRGNYISDLWASKWRMGTGILFMNHAAFKDYSFSRMEEQELAAHLFMGALMTKSRGAWGHHNKTGYMSDQYGEIEQALRYLQVDKSKFEATLSALKEEQLLGDIGLQIYDNPVADKIVTAVDEVLNANKEWYNRTGIRPSPIRYGKVKTVLGAYNTIKHIQDRNFKPLSLNDINPEALDRIEKTMGEIEVDGKKLKDIPQVDLLMKISGEATEKWRQDYVDLYFTPLMEQLGFPIGIVKGKVKVGNVLLDNKTEAPHTSDFIELINQFAGDLSIDVQRGEATTVSVRELADAWARKNGITKNPVENFDRAVGEIGNAAERSLSENYRNHNLTLPIHNNIFLRSIKSVNSIKSKDSLFKLVMGLETDDVEVSNLHNKMMNLFGRNGKLLKNITDYNIEGVDKEGKEGVPGEVTEQLAEIQPVYNMMRSLNKGVHPTGAKGEPLNRVELAQIADQVGKIRSRLPESWRQTEPGLEAIATDVFHSRLLGGGNVMANAALSELQKYGLLESVVGDGGIARIDFPKIEAVERHYVGDPVKGRKINEAIRTVAGVFNPSIVNYSNVLKLGDKTGEINPERFINIAKNIQNSSVQDFISRSADIIGNMEVAGEYQLQLDEIRSLVRGVDESFAGKEVEANMIDLIDANSKMRAILDSLIERDLIGEGSAKILNDLIRDSENVVSNISQRGRTWNVLDAFQKVSSSIDKFIKDELTVEFQTKDKLAEITMKLSNAYAKADPNLSPAESRKLIEKLTRQLHEFVTEEEYSPKNLDELILELGQTRKWKDLRRILDPILKTISARNVANDLSFDKNAVANLKILHNEKKEKKSSLTTNQIILKHETIQKRDNPNELNPDFQEAMDEAYSGQRTYGEVFNEWIYQPLIEKGIKENWGATKTSKEISDFRKHEAARLIQDMYGGSQRWTAELSGNTLKLREKPVKDSLSIQVMDRPGTVDALGAYQYVILMGGVDYKGRRQQIDDIQELGGKTPWIQKTLDESIPYDADKYDQYWEYQAASDFNLGIQPREFPSLSNDIYPTDSKNVYMRLSPKLRIIFPSTTKNLERLQTDFDSIYYQKESQYQSDTDAARGSIRAERLKKGFKHLLSTVNEDPSNPNNMRTKMMFVHLNRVIGPQFDQMLTDISGRGSYEYNMFKRMFIADGGTTTKITREATRFIREFHPDTGASDMALEILRRADKKLYVDIINDESDFFENLRNVQTKVANSMQKPGVVPLEQELKQLFGARLTAGEYPSLETYFLDGNKFASEGFARFLWALSGRVGDFNGAKTNIMDGRLLGKGFIIYHPEIAAHMKGDILIGESVAKSFGGYSRQMTSAGVAMPIKSFEFVDPGAGHFSLRTGWESQLANITGENQMAIDLGSVGIGWTADRRTGVNLSNSMVDMQSVSHLEQAKRMFQISSVINNLQQIENSKEHSNGELLRFLHRIKAEDFANTSPTYNLGEALAEYGIREGNPLIRKSLDKLLQSEYFEALTERPFTHGEETIIMADVENRLTLPTYLKVTSRDLLLGTAGETKTSNVIYQYGGGSITNSMSNVQLGIESILDTPIIARDPDTGIDYVFTVDKIEKGKITKVSHYSSMQESVSGTDKEIRGLSDMNLVQDAEGNLRVNQDFVKNVENILANIHDIVGKTDKFTHGDLWHLIHQQSPRQGDIPEARRIDGVTNILGLYNNRQDGYHRDLTGQYKMTTGMSLNSIPKVLKDQPLVRIEEILGKEMNGLSTVNNFDIRVTLQRDFDGDHLFKYLKMPSIMTKDYVDDMGDITDYKMFAEKQMRHHLTGENFNMLGFDAAGVAGMHPTNIGFDLMANHVSGMKRTLSTVIGVKGTLSYLLNSGLHYNGQPLVDNQLLNKNMNLPKDVADIYVRTAEIFQNALDIWEGQHPVSENLGTLKNYFLYGELPSKILKEGAGVDPVLEKHTSNNFFTEDTFGKSGSHREIQRELFDIIHYTLKGTKDMYNDVWDESGRRTPLPRELRNTHDDIKSLFENPDLYLFRAILRKISYQQRSKNSTVRDQGMQLKKKAVAFFFPTDAKYTTHEKVYESVEAMLSKGRYKEAYARMGRAVKNVEGKWEVVPIFSLPEGQEGITGSIGGIVLNEMMRKPIFYQKDFSLDPDNSQTIQSSLSNVERAIESMMAFGEFSYKEIKDMSNREFDETFPAFDIETTGMKRENAKGIMRSVAESQFKREMAVLASLNNEGFPDKNLIERTEHRIFGLRKVLNVLDRDIVRDRFLSKNRDLVVNYVPTKQKGSRWKRQFYLDSGTLYRLKGDVKLEKFNDESVELGNLKYVDYVKVGKNGKTVSLERGYTYILDKKPVQFVSMADEMPAYEHAFSKATMVGELDAGSLLAQVGINKDKDPYTHDLLVTDINQLKGDIQRAYSETLEGVNKKKVNYADKFQHNNIETSFLIDSFFQKWFANGAFQNHRNTDFINKFVRLLIQPRIQRNIFYKDGSTEVPYYKTNQHLVEAVFKWLRAPSAGPRVKSNEMTYNFRAKEIIKSIVKDQNAFKDNRMDHLSRSMNKTRGMRTARYRVDWEHYGRTTSDEITRDWFFHPVISKVLQDMYADPGGIFSRDDRIYIDYGKQIKRAEQKTERGCATP